MKQSIPKHLGLALGLTLALSSCHSLRGSGASFGALVGAREGGLGGAAIGALAGYGAGALVEDHAHWSDHGGCRRCAPPPPRHHPDCR